MVHQLFHPAKQRFECEHAAIVLDGRTGEGGADWQCLLFADRLLNPPLVHNMRGFHDGRDILRGHVMIPAIGNAGSHLLMCQIDVSVPRKFRRIFMVTLIPQYLQCLSCQTDFGTGGFKLSKRSVGA